MAASALRTAVSNGLPVILALFALNAVVVGAAALLHPVGDPAGQLAAFSYFPWEPRYAAEQILIHVGTGFAVGALVGGLSKGLVGAAFGPLMDIDHLSLLMRTEYFGRAGHSLVLLAALILVVGWAGFWKWGAVDFAFFSSIQMTTHFAVAPPGFPLLSPFTMHSFVLPVWVYVAATALLLVGAWVTRHRLGPSKAPAIPFSLGNRA